MQTWLELESRFRALMPTARHLRVDFQWGAAGEHHYLTGIGNSSIINQFHALVQFAGKCFNDVISHTDQSISASHDSDYCKRWLYALKEWSGAFQFSHVLQQIDDDGNNAGSIYTGCINDVAEVSAIFCLNLHSKYPMTQPTNSSTTVNNYLVNSQVGLLNTGDISHVKNIAINVGRLQEQGQSEIAKTIDELLQAVTASNAWGNDEKAELLDQIEELSKQAVLSPDQRAKPGIIKAIVGGIGAAIGTTASLSDIWSTWGPVIRSYFQI